MSKFYAYLEDFHEMTIIIPHRYRKNPVESFEAIGNDEEIPLEIVSRQTIGDENKYIVRFDGYIFLNKTYYVYDDQKEKSELYTGKIVRTELFDDIYFYDGNDLGHTYSKKSTTFKLWTPVAKYIKVKLTSPNDEEKIYEATYKKIGIWTVTVEGDLEGYRYQFMSYVNGKEHTFTDPYAVSSTANGTHSYVVNKKNFYKMRHKRPDFSGRLSDAIIYEMSVRDFTIDESINAKHPGKYLGAIERNLKTKNNHKAGFDYVKSLGVTHLQLMPIYDFETTDELNPKDSYNWGYDPMQYNVPEGSYSSDPDDPYTRINELKEMIDTFHEHGMRIVMDVVYNHVYDVNTFPFEKIIPGYAYRVDDQGILTNSSGCGSDMATERKMIRKFIIDSVMYWVKEYKIDGFRFDLMGLIDVKTMNTLRQKLELNQHDLIVYGEGWHMSAPIPAKNLSHMFNKNILPTIGFFNDKFREEIKGATFNPKQKGYALGNSSHLGVIKHLLLGSVLNKFLFKYPSQSINYVACHDNHTLHDKIKLAFPDKDENFRNHLQKFATSIVLLSQGVPFIHMGQEFYRTKQGVENSYKSPDKINLIDWQLVDKYQEDIKDFKKLVKLRKELSCLRLLNPSEIKNNAFVSCSEAGTCVLEVCKGENHTIVIFKNNVGEETLSFDETFNILYTSNKHELKAVTEITLNEVSTVVLKKQKKEATDE
ncbi:type I pullulanase [Liberiplasma polymorphum]|uniref:type I pullulanase n=1 Tax=Liberiplasma polymorphum TaxID=3374570 RepID=UPI0037731D46